MTEPTRQPLLTPVWMGDLLLPNRIMMAPLTRMRAANSGHVPTELQVRYYAQRASAGIIIGECTAISPQGYGWADTPGVWSEAGARMAHRHRRRPQQRGPHHRTALAYRSALTP